MRGDIDGHIRAAVPRQVKTEMGQMGVDIPEHLHLAQLAGKLRSEVQRMRRAVERRQVNLIAPAGEITDQIPQRRQRIAGARKDKQIVAVAAVKLIRTAAAVETIDARPALQPVIAIFAVQDVVAAAAIERIGAFAAPEPVVAVLAVQRVVAVAAVEQIVVLAAI